MGQAGGQVADLKALLVHVIGAGAVRRSENQRLPPKSDKQVKDFQRNER